MTRRAETATKQSQVIRKEAANDANEREFTRMDQRTFAFIHKGNLLNLRNIKRSAEVHENQTRENSRNARHSRLFFMGSNE